MYEWHIRINKMVDLIDKFIVNNDTEYLSLSFLANELHYSEFFTTRKFKSLLRISFKEYIRMRKLAFALIDLRDSNKNILEIAIRYGFSSHEAFTRAFKLAYGLTPKEYRKNPQPLVLRTKIIPFDRYFFGLGEIGMVKSNNDVKVYFISLPAHKFLHIKNYESNGYWDFWQKQDSIVGQDCDTICGLLRSIKGKLDSGDSEVNEFAGQVMAHIQEADGKVPEAYGIRLPIDYNKHLPSYMLCIDVHLDEYIVFEHSAFDYEQENETVHKRLAEAINDFSYEETGYAKDNSIGRISYYFHDPEKYCKQIFPVKKLI